MEGLTRLVSESMARHGFDRPLDYRRLHWSRWFRCESHHSLLFVPSKPGVFALAEEIMDLAPHGGTTNAHVETAASAVARSEASGSCTAHVETDTSSVPPARSAAEPTSHQQPVCDRDTMNREAPVEERRFSAASSAPENSGALAPRRLLAVTHFFDADDMAFTLDRMLTRNNPLRTRLTSGRYFVRFVAIEDESQRLSIATALNQWMANTSEKASGIGAHFASSLELTDAHGATDASSVPPARSAATTSAPEETAALNSSPTTPQLDSGAATNIHCPSPFPSGF